MTFLGFLAFFDPPKPGIEKVLADIAAAGIGFKLITGDNLRVALELARRVGIAEPVVLTGAELRQMSDRALPRQAERTQVFAEIEPNRKERIILALRKAGHGVGFLGDGINDASALHAADVGISVDTAVDVAKEAAEIVLLERDPGVLIGGVREGRRTFANTLKYIFITTSANFGNMLSMAGASLLLSFLPLLPTQILLNNFLSDFPAMTIATDRVDPELVDRPLRPINRLFGLVSLPWPYLSLLGCITLGYTAASEAAKGWFFRREGGWSGRGA